MIWTKKTTPSNERFVELADNDNTIITDNSGEVIEVFSKQTWSKRNP